MILLAAVYIPAFSVVLEITRPGLKGWGVSLV